MPQALQDLKVAILVTDGFEQVELIEPRKALEQAGAQVRVISPMKGKVKGWNHTDWGNEIPVTFQRSTKNGRRVLKVAWSEKHRGMKNIEKGHRACLRQSGGTDRR